MNVAPRAPHELSPDARARYVEAQDLLRQMRIADAYECARPLFVACPESYDVQDLRCQLAITPRR